MQNQIEAILADWVAELGVPVHHGREVTGFSQDDTGCRAAWLTARPHAAPIWWAATAAGA